MKLLELQMKTPKNCLSYPQSKFFKPLDLLAKI